MNLLFDLHTHTVMSGHAYSTLQENLAAAKEAGLMAYGFSEHAPAMPGSVSNLYFVNFKALPESVNGVRLLGGIELNITDYKGTVDVPERVLDKVDYAIASLHLPCITIGTQAENTAALIGAMEHPLIKIIGHPDDSRYPLDYKALVQAAAATHTALEVNNSSLKPNAMRLGAHDNYHTMLELCQQYQVPVLVGSDSHYADAVGKFDDAIALLEAVHFPPALVLNTQADGLDYVLNRK